MEFLTRDEVAKYFRVHPRTVMRWLKQGSLRGYKLGTGKTALLRISKSEIERFMEKSKITK
jgi:excisionase family DNA binding protein